MIPELQDITNFIKESMYIDGEVKFDSIIEMNKDSKSLKGILYKIDDINRGEFYVAWLKEKEE